jgi:redox-sensitive bicupin YhaK (pirin superfamily)
MNQDAYLYASILATGDKLAHALAPGRLGYVHVARGSVTVNGIALNAGDAVKLADVEAVELEGTGDAEVLVFDLPR